tara:strand:- start:845 stop:1651 length:807 start_codon:yes stop_codon:yes gene_type:complete
MEQNIWHESNELFFKSLGDEAQLQALCHMKSHEEFSVRSMKYQLPIIILSVMCGSGNFVSTSFPDNQATIILGVGVLSIFTSIISSVAQYLKLAEKSEAHRIAFVSWEKYYNNIRFQLSKRREEREELVNYMSSITNEYQRLQEISPLLPDKTAKSVLYHKKKTIKQGMSLPVSLRSIQPTTWWDNDEGGLIHKNNTIINISDSDEEDVKKPNKKKRKRKSLDTSTETEDIYMEDIGESMYQIGSTNQEEEIVIVEDIERDVIRESKI